MNKQYNELKEKIIEAVPDIIDLVFGCKVKCIGVYYIYLRAKDNHYTFKCDLTDTIMSFTKKCFDEEFEIIGRDITLEDCLIAMRKKEEGQNEYYYFIDSFGGFWKHDGDLENIEYLHIDWIPNKPLQDQPKETLTFLYNLICKK